MISLAILFCGFSMISIPLILFNHLQCKNSQVSMVPKISGVVLLVGLFAVQLIHYLYLESDILLVKSTAYYALLFLIAPSFYFYSLELLKIDIRYSPFQWLHFLPIISVFIVPQEYLIPLSFAIGSGYVAWLLLSVIRLSRQSNDFLQALIAITVLFALAITAMILAFTKPFLADVSFYSLYAVTIGLAFMVALLALLQNPLITGAVAEAAEATYAVSTLKNVDIKDKLALLETLMSEEKVYRNENLTLNTLSDEIGLSHHQLSELINTQLGKGFSQYLREYRIAEAKKLLIDEPKSSILAISLEVGFNSQSNFYTAFKKTEGITPGQFRKQI